jgi:20S proteasome subunit beta 4
LKCIESLAGVSLIRSSPLTHISCLHCQNPYMVNIILGGYDKDVGASLYYIDYIATLHKIDKGAFGYGSYFCLSLMDKLYHPDMTVEEAVDLVDKCIKEIRLRLVVAPQNFVIKIVDKDGAREYARRELVGDNAPAEAATAVVAA